MTRIHQIFWLSIIAFLSLECIFTSAASECHNGQENCKNDKTNVELSLSEIWSEYLGNLYDIFQCKETLNKPRPIYPDTTWMYMRGVYNGLVGPTISTIPPLTEGHGFRVPYNVEQKPMKGRSIIAVESVKKGEIVWTSQQTAKFEDSRMFYRFLESLPMDLSCDVITWAYPGVDESSDSDSTPFINVDIDAGTLMNSADYDDSCVTPGCSVLIDDDDDSSDDEEEDHYDEIEESIGVNCGCTRTLAKDIPGGCDYNLFAIRDIQPGEEFMGSHSDFAKELELLHGLPVAEKWFRSLYLPSWEQIGEEN